MNNKSLRLVFFTISALGLIMNNAIAMNDGNSNSSVFQQRESTWNRRDSYTFQENNGDEDDFLMNQEGMREETEDQSDPTTLSFNPPRSNFSTHTFATSLPASTLRFDYEGLTQPQTGGAKPKVGGQRRRAVSPFRVSKRRTTPSLGSLLGKLRNLSIRSSGARPEERTARFQESFSENDCSWNDGRTNHSYSDYPATTLLLRKPLRSDRGNSVNTESSESPFSNSTSDYSSSSSSSSSSVNSDASSNATSPIGEHAANEAPVSESGMDKEEENRSLNRSGSDWSKEGNDGSFVSNSLDGVHRDFCIEDSISDQKKRRGNKEISRSSIRQSATFDTKARRKSGRKSLLGVTRKEETGARKQGKKLLGF